jgi:transglutaminase-like putative cysteine protease
MNLRTRVGGAPEDSRAMRVVVAAAVEIGVLAVVLQGAVDSTAAVAALILAPAGYAFSYVRRRKSGVVIKVILAVGLLLVLDRFIGQVRFATTVDQARIPLASLFLWVQVLHAFDVPRRRDLAFSMVSSTTLIAAGGALALTTSFIWIVLAWAIAAGAWLWLSARPQPTELTPTVAIHRIAPERPRRAPVARSAAVTGVAAAVLAVTLFAATPRVPASLIRTPPFHLAPSGNTPADPTQGVTNPGARAPDSDGVVDFQADAYPGFGDSLDLRARGQLSDDVVFRVRAEWPSLWRAQAFDTFDGSSWTESRDTWHLLQSSGSDSYEASSGASGWNPSLTQTFYLDGQQPNVLFAAAEPQRIYFPSGGLQMDREGVIRSPILLDPGTVYSVESSVPAATAEDLRAVGSFKGGDDPGIARYLQLPEDLPGRDRRLAAQITANAPTEFDAVEAVQTWLQKNTVYDLTVPREPAGVDSVDWFLFQSRRGFCEHIASAMAILLRSVGIPARVVTGYGPGQRNPFTGYFEVRQSDAHAWVEVLYPHYGWMPYDPTFGVPFAAHPWGSLVGQEIFQALAGAMHAVPAPVRRTVGSTVHAVAAAGRALAGVWPVGLLVIGLAAWGVLRRRRHPRRARAPDDIGRAFEDLVETLAAAGVPRNPACTPAELLERASADPAIGTDLVRSATVVVRTFERARYAPAGERPDPAEVARARDEAARARALPVRRAAVTSRDVPEHQAPS